MAWEKIPCGFCGQPIEKRNDAIYSIRPAVLMPKNFNKFDSESRFDYVQKYSSIEFIFSGRWLRTNTSYIHVGCYPEFFVDVMWRTGGPDKARWGVKPGTPTASVFADYKGKLVENLRVESRESLQNRAAGDANSSLFAGALLFAVFAFFVFNWNVRAADFLGWLFLAVFAGFAAYNLFVGVRYHLGLFRHKRLMREEEGAQTAGQ